VSEKKTYIAFALDYREMSCGCPYTETFYVYDRTGNKPERFDNRDDAVTAAKALQARLGWDNWNVI
jgi:hypothetical protein